MEFKPIDVDEMIATRGRAQLGISAFPDHVPFSRAEGLERLKIT
ncbi:MAG TPA: hypothetical protein VFE47_18385 [Tepidisphaeraceae bacterium]|jgi:hypothetical protein|nr:hypothetical protein [Tepidisphaeraceae bacterium]